MNDLPQTPNERALEMKILTLVSEALIAGATFDECLAVLERVRYFTTEIKLITECK